MKFRIWLRAICVLFALSSYSLTILAAESLIASESKADAKQTQVALKVIDPFLELHTGPGRGYPIFHVIEQDESVRVLRKRTNWYFVEDRRQRQGWVKQEGLARTLAPTGMPAALPEIQHGDFLAQQGRVGFSFGQQSSAETASFSAGYRVLSWAGIEAELGQLFGQTIDGTSYSASIIVEPIKSWAFTPFISKGYGRQHWQFKRKLQVGSDNSREADFEYTGVGVNYYIGLSFVVRGEFRSIHLDTSEGSGNQTAWRLGFSSFF